jgi:aminoglycoside 3-N-acetyltransferase
MGREQTKAEIVKGLRELGVAPSASVMVHSSLRSFGWVEDGADTVIDALVECVAPSGNVLVPTITGTREHSRENPPRFDVRATPCWTGAIPETLRKRADALRSLHPTHSVAVVGADKERLTAGHDLADTPCGKGTPYYRLAEMGGFVVLFGVDLECVTLFHTAEELAGVPYHLQPELVDAEIIDYSGRRHILRTRIHKWGDARNFSVMEEKFVRAGVIRYGRVLESRVRIIQAMPLIELTLAELHRNPQYLLA